MKGAVSMFTINEIQRRIAPILKNYDVREAFLFGSYARGEATENSDIDIRVDKGDSQKLKSLLGVSGLHLDLNDALGREVDLLTCLPRGPLSSSFIENLKKDEIKIYGNIQ